MEAASLHKIGAHETWIEEPDVFGIRLIGPVVGEELAELMRLQAEWGHAKTRYFVLCDVSSMGSVSPSARRVMNEAKTLPGVEVINVCYGASFTLRVLADMVARARKLLRPNDSLGEGIFVATEQAARTVIADRRG